MAFPPKSRALADHVGYFEGATAPFARLHSINLFKGTATS
jgi:hypothetical protein